MERFRPAAGRFGYPWIAQVVLYIVDLSGRILCSVRLGTLTVGAAYLCANREPIQHLEDGSQANKYKYKCCLQFYICIFLFYTKIPPGK